MSLGKKALVVAIVSLLGLWGCAKGPSNGSAAAERIKFLEGKIGKLEKDFRAVASARDQIKNQLTTLEEQHNQLRQEVAKFQKERDTLRVQVTARTGERDALQVQYDQFRKAIKEAIGQAEAAALPLNPQPVTASGVAGTPGKLCEGCSQGAVLLEMARRRGNSAARRFSAQRAGGLVQWG